jgi:hypothetical protein
MEIKMMDGITVTREQAAQIFKAINGIGEALKRLPSTPETAPIMYGIVGNLAVIQTNLVGVASGNRN